MVSKFLCFAIILLLPEVVLCQYQVVTVAKEKVDGIGPCQPSIFINPRSPNQMMICVMNDKLIKSTGARTKQNTVYLSRDFGMTWRLRKVKSKFGDFGDPCIIADNTGYFYFFHLSDPQKLGWEGKMVMDRIVCQRSTNGNSWNSGVSVGHNPPKKHEKPSATFDENSGRIYVAWTQFDNYGSTNPQDSAHIMVAFSDDRGLSWGPSMRINQIGGNCSNNAGTPSGPVSSTGPDQDVYVTWALNEKIYFDRSVDGGVTWLKNDIVVAEQPGGWQVPVPGFNKTSSIPVNACDLSYGDHHGTIYVSWADQRNGPNDTDIWISKSTDRGNTWSAPRRVNDDHSEPLGAHQCYSWMSVDPITGYVYIVYYDRRSQNDLMTEVYLAVSVDGGESFSNTKISLEPFEPDSDIYMGENINISSFGGYVRPVWTQLKDGYLSILTAIIDPK